MKKVIALLIAAALLLAAMPVGIMGAFYSDEHLDEIMKKSEIVFDASGNNSYSDAALGAVWGWTSEKDGMTISTIGEADYLKFYRTESYTDGGNVVVSDSVFASTGKDSSDFVIFSFLTGSDETDGEHIYTFYSDRTNTAGKEILKFKYRNDGIYPCTVWGQNADTYTQNPVIVGDNVPVRIFLMREEGQLKIVYQANVGGWATVYECDSELASFDGGLGTIRSFVKFGSLGAYTGFGDISIRAGKWSDVEYSTARRMEYLDRGLVAMKTNEGIYLSWRLLGTENYNSSFDLYRNKEKIATISDTTNYIDYYGTMDDEYYVVGNGDVSDSVKAFSSGENYFDIPLSQPPSVLLPDGTWAEYTPWDASAGDLDGDGEIEIVQRWDAPRVHAGQGGYTGGLILDAYELDGTVLWRIDLGVNVRCNTENIFTVYDYNSDGACELVIKTAQGSRDGTGRFVTEASLNSAIRNANNYVDYRNGWSTILEGDEYYTLFDGRNGKALDTIYYPFPRGSGKDLNYWGDDYGHRSEKFLDVPAYLDGTHPSVVTWRGIYDGQSGKGPGRTAVAAYRIVNNRFQLQYTFDTKTAGNERYIGQGNHNITVGDVDQDGKDEIISGNLCLDENLTVKWCSRRGHGDALHLGNYDPTTFGLEYMTVHENAPYGMTVYNAASGRDLFHVDGTGDTGRGVMANVGSGGYYQIWGAGTYQSNGNWDFTETPLSNQSYNYRIFWDADTYDELLDAVNSSTDHTPVITNYNPETGSMEEIFRAWDSETINTTKATVALSADILGDWREEVLAMREDMKALRVFVSPIYTENKVYTLLHDCQYRQAIAWQNEYYNQPPHIGFYLSGNNDRYDQRAVKPNIKVVRHQGGSYEKAVYVEPGKLEETKKPDSKYLIDLDGDYFHSQSVLCWIGGSGEIENTRYSLSGRVYSFVGAGNVRHSGVMRSWGLSANDGKFLVIGGNNAGNYSANFNISSKGAVITEGEIDFDFAFLKNFSSDGTKDRGTNDAWIRLGNAVTMYYNCQNLTLSINDKVIHTFANADDAQKWTNCFGDIDVKNGKIELALSFGDGSVHKETVAYEKNLPFYQMSVETKGWGCVLLDDVTLYSEDVAGYTFSTEGFEAISYQPITKGVIDMDVIPFVTADNVIGISASDSQPAGYGDLNVIIRFNPDGTMDAYNNGGYASYSAVRYNAGEQYHIHIETDVTKKTYSAWVSDEEGNRYTLALNYAYRSSAPAAKDLGKLVLVGGSGVGGKKFAAANVTFYNELAAAYITQAEINQGELKLAVNGKMNVYIAFYNSREEVIGYAVREFTTGGSKTVALPADCAYVKLYSWDKASLAPMAAVRKVY